MAKRVNVYSDYAFQVDLKERNEGGDLATPTLGTVTGIKLRLAATKTGAAIDPNVGTLAADETTTAGRFAYVMDTALLVAHILPLGNNTRFYAIWSKAGDIDMEAIPFLVGVGRLH